MHYDARCVHPFPVSSKGEPFAPIPTPDMLVSSALGGRTKLAKTRRSLFQEKLDWSSKCFPSGRTWETEGAHVSRNKCGNTGGKQKLTCGSFNKNFYPEAILSNTMFDFYTGNSMMHSLSLSFRLFHFFVNLETILTPLRV